MAAASLYGCWGLAAPRRQAWQLEGWGAGCRMLGFSKELCIMADCCVMQFFILAHTYILLIMLRCCRANWPLLAGGFPMRGVMPCVRCHGPSILPHKSLAKLRQRMRGCGCIQHALRAMLSK